MPFIGSSLPCNYLKYSLLINLWTLCKEEIKGRKELTESSTLYSSAICHYQNSPQIKFSNSVWNVYIIVQKRLFQCTCLHSFLLEILSAISLGGLLACTCHPWLPREEWKACQWIAGKTFPNKCPLMRGCWEQRPGEWVRSWFCCKRFGRRETPDTMPLCANFPPGPSDFPQFN